MRRTITLICFLMLLAAPAAAQDGQRTASPPIVTVELSGIEPRPADLPAEILYGGLGGGGGEPLIPPPGVYWSVTPSAFVGAFEADFTACGYSNDQPPIAALTYPDGKNQKLIPNTDEQPAGCYRYTIPWEYGQQLGIYTLTLNHPDGQLTHTWGMDYPFCRTAENLDGQNWLMGFAPGEQLSVIFFMPGGSDPMGLTYVAQRNVQADAEGALMLDINATRSAPFNAEDLRYVILNARHEIDYPDAGAFDLTAFESLGYTRAPAPIPTPYYASYHSTEGATLGFSRCSSAYGRFVEVVPSAGGSTPLYADVNSADAVGQLNVGAPAEVLEYRPAITNGRVAVWKHLRAEDGTSGWNPTQDFSPANTFLVPGGRAEAAQAAVYDEQSGETHGVNPVLHSAPADDAPGVMELSDGTPLQLFGYRIADGNRWWYVQTDDGTAGWLSEFDPSGMGFSLTALPWATIDVNQPGAVWQTCPNAPPTRLVPGIGGRVMPGIANRLRADPENGAVIGQLNPGDQFYIQSGPVCGDSEGLTWWNISANGVEGWTAEGQGSDYWLEPAP